MPKVLTHVKARNTSVNNVIFVSSKRIWQYNELDKVIIKMVDTIFKNSDNSNRSDPHRLLLNVLGKNMWEVINILLHQILASTIHGKI